MKAAQERRVERKMKRHQAFLLLVMFLIWTGLPAFAQAKSTYQIDTIPAYTGYTTARLNVRENPGQHQELLDTLEIGTEVTVNGSYGGCWLRIKTAGIPEGYVYNTYIVKSLDDAIADAVAHGRIPADEADTYKAGLKKQAKTSAPAESETEEEIEETKETKEVKETKATNETTESKKTPEKAVTDETKKAAETAEKEKIEETKEAPKAEEKKEEKKEEQKEEKKAEDTTEKTAEAVGTEKAEENAEEIKEAAESEETEEIADAAEDLVDTEENKKTLESSSKEKAGEHTHTYVENVIQEATCTATGRVELTCSVCGDSYVDVIPRVEHKLGPFVVAKEPGWFSPGVQYQTCQVCGTTLASEEIPSNPMPFFLILGGVVLVAGTIITVLVVRSRNQ